jgi:hypothetical protein
MYINTHFRFYYQKGSDFTWMGSTHSNRVFFFKLGSERLSEIGGSNTANSEQQTATKHRLGTFLKLKLVRLLVFVVAALVWSCIDLCFYASLLCGPVLGTMCVYCTHGEYRTQIKIISISKLLYFVIGTTTI